MTGFNIIDLVRRTSITKDYYNYRKLWNEKHSGKELFQMQKEKLSVFLTGLKFNNHFGKLIRHIEEADIKSNPYAVLSELPYTNKEYITNNSAEILNNQRVSERNFTGGSTGSPFHYYKDKRSISQSRAFNYFLWNLFLDYRLGDKIIVIAGSSLGKTKSISTKIYNKLQNKDFIQGAIINNENAIEFASQINRSPVPVFIYAYPSSLNQFINILDSINYQIDLTKIKGVICTSETLHNNQKEYFESNLQCKVLNVYGANDGGIISGSFNNSSFFYNGLNCYAENLNELGENEIVLTDLNSLAFPFVRYRVGDLGDIAQANDPWPFMIENLQGRTRDFVYLDSERKIHGSAFNKIFSKFEPVVEYQIIQTDMVSCTVRIKLASNKNLNDFYPALRQALDMVLRPLKVIIVTVASIDRLQNGKLKNIVSYVS